MKKTTLQILMKCFFYPYPLAQVKRSFFISNKALKAFTVLIALFSSPALAQSTFNSANGNWNDPNNWTPNGVPAGTTSFIIPAGDVANMVSGDSYTGSGTITLSGGLAAPSGATFKPTGTVTLNDNGAYLSGGGTVQLTTLTINTANATDSVSLINSTATAPISIGIGNATGTLNFINGFLKLTGQTLAFTKTGVINVSGTSNFANGADGIGDLDAAGGTITFLNNAPNAVTVNGPAIFYNIDFGAGNVNFDLKSPSVVINGAAILTSQQGKLGNTSSPIWGPSSTLYVDYASSFDYTPGKEWVALASGTIGVTPGYPNNVTLTNIGTSQGGFHNGNGWVPNISLAINGTFTLGNNITNAQVDFSNVPAFVCGGFVLNTGSRFTAPTATMTVNGNWTDNQVPVTTGNNLQGFFINGTSTVLFGGTGTCIAPNTITAPSGNSETFDNLSVINGAYVALNSPVIVAASGILTLTAGVFTTSPVNSLTVDNTSTAAVVVSSQGNSFINGPLTWDVAAAPGIYNFPVGVGCIPLVSGLPLQLVKAAGTAATVTVTPFNTSSGGTVDGTLSSLSTTEYWSLSSTADLTGSIISLGRAIPVAAGTLIGKSNTTANGIYTSIGGTSFSTLAASGVANSTDIGPGTSLFFALGMPPIVSTFAATSITTTGATLNGGFNTQGSSLTTSFNYGLTTSYGTTVTTLHSPINSTSGYPDSAVITGLTANTLYNYIATDGANSGSNVTFTTAPYPPTVGTATNPTRVGFDANWTAPAITGTATYWYVVRVSSDSTFATGVQLSNSIASGTTSYTFTNLSSATNYYYEVETVNATATSGWSATSLGIATDIVPSPPCNNNTSNDGATTFTNSAPIIDGNIDAVWANAPSNPINIVTLGTNNNTQSWKSLWTADSLYLLVQVTDASLISQGALLNGSFAIPGVQQSTSQNYYEADGIEFYLDPDYSNGNNYDGVNDVQLRFNLGSSTISGQSVGGTAQFVGAAFLRDAPLIDWKMQVTPGGYLLEAAIPWGKNAANPGVFLLPNGTYGTPTSGQTIGIDVNVNDQDNVGGGRQAQIQWTNSSTDAYLHPNVFSNAGLQVCPIAPIVINPTKDSITSTSAILGATVVSSGKDPQLNISPLTSRGTAYDITLPVVSNAMAEGDTTLGIYTSLRIGLSPQTKYYYEGYANNVAGLTGVSQTDSFYTLSEIPTVQPALTSSSCSQLTLNWTSVAFPPVSEATQTGYIILRRQDGTNPTAAGLSTRIATVQASLPSGTTLIATITDGATLTYTDATAVSGTAYNYLLVPYTWDGTVADSTYNYFTTGAPSRSVILGSGLLDTVVATQPTCSNPRGNITITPATGVSYSFDGGVTYVSTPSIDTIPGTYSVQVKNSSGCVSADTSITIIAVSIPAAPTPMISTLPTCAAPTGVITVTIPSTGVTYSFDNGVIFQAGATSSPLAAGTTYQVVVKNPSGCVSAPTAITISPAPSAPSIDLTASPSTPVAPGTTVTLTASGSNLQGAYLWSADNDSSVFSAQHDSITTVQPSKTTLYTFTDTTSTGCTGSHTITVTVLLSTTPICLHPMKGFTPNSDGHNDYWKVFDNAEGCNITVSVHVYNRWGGLVYSSGNYNNDWNGKYKDNTLPDGTYYYIISATSSNGASNTLTGNVTIIR